FLSACLILALVPPFLRGEEQPIDFADAATRAMENSRELRQAYGERNLREGAWVLGRRAYLPRLSLGVVEDDRLSRTGSDSFIKNYSLTVDQLIFDGGRTSGARNIERAELELLGSALERQALDIGDRAIAAYRYVLLKRGLLEIREEALRFLSEQYVILCREAELGLALAMDLVEAEITLAEAKIEILSLRLELEEAEQGLAELLGMEELPPLSETVDIGRSPLLPSPEQARFLAESRSPVLAEGRFAIARQESEVRFARLSWIPTVRVSGSAGLQGGRYPLGKFNWSVGITVEFSSPWMAGSLGGNAGWEPPHDRNAGIRGSLNPLPDPASSMTIRQAELALGFEKARYEENFRELGRTAELGVEKCLILERKRRLALESMELEAERYRLAELRMDLGQFTRVELMEARLDYAQRETAAVEIAVSLLEAERELEKLLDLRPGELEKLGSLGGE
ncbi:MAG: TolC family protein, partial [Treponema sp.]|nr:TolC family protein [Treponema sp.]